MWPDLSLSRRRVGAALIGLAATLGGARRASAAQTSAGSPPRGGPGRAGAEPTVPQDFYRPEDRDWCPAFDRALSQIAARANKRGATWNPGGADLLIPPGTYEFADTWHVQGVVSRIAGFGSGPQQVGGTVLRFPSGRAGIVLHGSRTDGRSGGPLPPPGRFGAGGTIFEHLLIEGGGGSPDGSADGFQARARCTLRHVHATRFERHGFNLQAAGDASQVPYGNINHSTLDHCTATANGRSGAVVRGADANGLVIINFDATGNGQWGWELEPFLGIVLIGGHSASNGQLDSGLGGRTSIVFEANAYWVVRRGAGAAAATTRPGTDAGRVWLRMGDATVPAPNYPRWERGGPYWEGGTGVLGGGLHLNPYAEGGQGPYYLGVSATSVGGVVGPGKDGPGASIDTLGGITRVDRPFAVDWAEKGRRLATVLGAGPSIGLLRETTDSADPGGLYREQLNNGVLSWMRNGFRLLGLVSPRAREVAGAEQWSRAGRNAPVPGLLVPTALGLADESANEARVVRMGDAPPTRGDHARGEIVFSLAPVPGGHVGWVCTAAGSPGTWKPFGTISA